jgi:signal peptidase I
MNGSAERPPEKERRSRGFLNFLRSRPVETRQGRILACIVLWSVISFMAVNRFVCATVVVDGASMLPTLHPGERHLLNRWLHYVRTYHRGDLVVLQDGPQASSLAVKRIIGLPGEEVRLKGGAVFVNGRKLDEPYLQRGTRTYPSGNGQHLYRLGENAYFVLGDNREISADSREVGPVARERLLGTISP